MARLHATSPLLTCALLALVAAVLPTAHAQWRPDNFIANGDTCRSSGYSAGYNAAASACATARAQCQGGLMGSAPGSSIGAVSLPQCSNVAYGACQQAAGPAYAPCASQMAAGYGRCGASAFRSHYTAAASRACYSAATAITDVAPGTNGWAPRPYYPSGPSVPAIVSPGSVIGGGAGSAIGGAIAGDLGSAIGSAVGARIGNSVDRAAINTIGGLIGGRKMLAAPAAPLQQQN